LTPVHLHTLQTLSPTVRSIGISFRGVQSEKPKKWVQRTLFDELDISPQPSSQANNAALKIDRFEIHNPKLSAQQQKAVEAIASGRNVFVTGPAGSGKSFLIEYLAQNFDAQVTATTGLAALNIGGQILNRWAGIGLADEPADKIARRLLVAKWAQPVVHQLRTTRLLIIDEVSMLSGQTLDLLDQVLQKIRGNAKPFGGVQLALFGDFLQLPPVSKGRAADFCFKSTSWQSADFRYIELEQVFRQRDEVFAQTLKRIRLGKPTSGDITLLSQRNDVPLNGGLKPVHLFATNHKVDALNRERLRELPGPETTYLPLDSFSHDFAPNLWQSQDELSSTQAYLKTQLDRHGAAQAQLSLKPGAQVMLLKNLTAKWVNGSMGVVTRLLSNAVGVRFQDGEEGLIERKKWTLKDAQGDVVTRHQIPLKLAYGVSIHKSQGQTLDRAMVDLDGIFEKGQAYVALSRVKALAGLFLKGFSKEKLQAHPEAVAFYQHQQTNKQA
jgi:ATP-dependent DNA helicase PIF1